MASPYAKQDIKRKKTQTNERTLSVFEIFKKYSGFYILLTLPVIYFILFKYVPMIGNILAFRMYSPASPLFGTEWVGFTYFNQFITNPDYWVKFKNTFILSVGSVAVNFPLPILFALLLNEVKNLQFKKFVQTASYLPHFLSMVVVAGMILQILSPNSGILNIIRNAMHLPSINYIVEPKYFRAIYIISDVWQKTGWNAIIFIAALSGVDPELYEAALIDGANRLKQTIHITIPSIAPTIIISLILTIGGIMSVGFEKVLLLQNELNKETSDVISTYVYRMGLLESNYSYSTAVGLFEAIIGLILIGSANYLSNKLTDTGLW